jgi:hypothetical protein
VAGLVVEVVAGRQEQIAFTAEAAERRELALALVGRHVVSAGHERSGEPALGRVAPAPGIGVVRFHLVDEPVSVVEGEDHPVPGVAVGG